MKPLIASLMLVASAPALAGWEKVYEGSGVNRYVDPDSIVKDDEGDGYRTARVLSEYKMSEQDFKRAHPDGTRSSVSLLEYDCKRNRYRELAAFSHAGRLGNGRLVGAEVNVTVWMKPENPAFAPAARFVCGR